MPSWLRKLLMAGGKVTVRNQISASGRLERVTSIANELDGLVSLLAHLSAQDETVETAYFCHGGVRHVFKLDREGGFCGYRNIQMMLSFVQQVADSGRGGSSEEEQQRGGGGSGASESAVRPRIPDILRLQDMIEAAWDQGFNSEARIETGGIRGTRKYIGTSEALALFLSLGLPCEAQAYGKASRSSRAHDRLLDGIEAYFVDAVASSSTSAGWGDEIYRTRLPPVYLQHPGTSAFIRLAHVVAYPPPPSSPNPTDNHAPSNQATP